VSAQEFRVATQNIWKGLTQYHDLKSGAGGVCYDVKTNVCDPACLIGNAQTLAMHLKDALESKPALVGLQEVHDRVVLSCNFPEPALLAQLMGPGWNGIFGWTRSYYNGAFGNGIAHNVQHLWSYSFVYNHQGSQDRGLVVSLVRIGDRRLWFGSTHLDHQDVGLALRQAEEAKQFMSALTVMAAIPAILVGDFNLGRSQNCSPKRNCEQALNALMTSDGSFVEVSADTAASALHLAGYEPEERRKLDYIFLRDPYEQLEVLKQYVVHYRALGVSVTTPFVSRSLLPCVDGHCPVDHKTVVADFRFR
jgi:endonuclease/exonuclease/phosphatase family metal-dependent hydrolase